MRLFATFKFLFIIVIIPLSAAKAQQAGLGEINTIINQLRYSKPDISKVQMLLRLSTLYLNKTLNPAKDMDSALLLASDALDLARKLDFTKGQEDAIFLQGSIYIKQQHRTQLQQMLLSTSNENRIKLLLELGKSMLRTTYSQKSNRDSAIAFFREAWNQSDKFGKRALKEESQCLLGVVYLLNGKWQEGKAQFMEVVEDRKRAGDKAGELNALLRLATTVFCDDCSENLIALSRALELSRQIRDPALEAIVRLEKGYKHLNNGDLKEAEVEAVAALNIQQAIGYPAICKAYKALAMQSVYYSPTDYAYLSNAYYLLSDLGQVKGNLDQKLLYIFDVVHDAEETGMLEELDYTYFRLGNAYWELGKFDKSLEYHQQSAKLTEEKGNIIQVGLARRMTVALLRQGKAREALMLLRNLIDKKLLWSIEDKMYIAQSLGSCYNALKQYKLAEKYYLESVALSKQSPLRFQLLSYHGIAQFYVANTQYSRAEPYLKMLLTASPEQILPNYLIDVHLMQFKMDSARANYPAAIRHYQQYKILQDSIFNAAKSKQIEQLGVQYETEKNKTKITDLDRKNQLQASRLDRAQLVRNFTFAGIVLLFIIVALLYWQYRHKQQSAKLIFQKNEQLQRLLTEKEWLVKEIHHRVKNNFHIVASLLEIQSSYLKNKEALSAIKESQHRIHSMSIIHQKLYQSETLSTIHMPEYIYELVEYLRESYAIRENVGFSLQVENIELNHAAAITLGLILNEAITNSIKYAFAKTEDGQISISLSHISDSQILLSIADNGRGLPTDFDSKIGASMGMELLQGLTDDLGGSLTIETDGGTRIKVIFKHQAISTENVSFA